MVQRLRAFEGDVFETRSMPRLPPFRQLDLDITVRPGSEPIHLRPYTVAPHLLPELDRQIQLLDAGIIRPSISPYAAPVLFAPKKDGKLRMRVDYRKLNLQTVRDKFPTPTASDLIARTRGAWILSKIDPQSGFHQLRIQERDVYKRLSLHRMGSTSSRLRRSGSARHRLRFNDSGNLVLAEHIRGGYCVVYCDDVAVWSKTDDPGDHLDKLERVLRSLQEHKLLAKGSKCELFRTEMEFLGFMIGSDGVRPVPSKVEAVRAVPVPETVSRLCAFLGMANFFRHHIASFAEMAAPLTSLLMGTKQGRQRLVWSVPCQEAFKRLKEVLSSAPLLRHFDPTLRTAVHLDASQNAVGAVLLQWDVRQEHPRPVCFLSRKLKGAQYHYDPRNAEALAAQLTLTEWRHYLYGVSFELHSDHASLQSLMTQKRPSQRLLPMCEFLAEFDFTEIRQVKGSANVVPDFLSRPWEAVFVESSLHLLSHPREPRKNPLQVTEHGAGATEVVVLASDLDRIFVERYGSVWSLPTGVVRGVERPRYRRCGGFWTRRGPHVWVACRARLAE